MKHPHRFHAILMTLLALMGLGLAGNAPALTVDQVIRLKEAGVSNETIAQMLDAETKSRKMGYAGRYVVRQKTGKQVVVYEASNNKGVVEYPSNAAQEAGGVDRVTTALGFPTRVSVQEGSISGSQGHEVSQALPGSGGYTVHLTSYKNRDLAQREAALLKNNGLQAMVSKVEVKDKGTMYRVSVGSFKNSKAAKAHGEMLKSSGKVNSYWVGKK